MSNRLDVPHLAGISTCTNSQASQRLSSAFVVAFLTDPRILNGMSDDLDPENVARINQLLRQYYVKRFPTLSLVEHEFMVAAVLGERYSATTCPYQESAGPIPRSPHRAHQFLNDRFNNGVLRQLAFYQPVWAATGDGSALRQPVPFPQNYSIHGHHKAQIKPLPPTDHSRILGNPFAAAGARLLKDNIPPAETFKKPLPVTDTIVKPPVAANTIEHHPYERPVEKVANDIPQRSTPSVRKRPTPTEERPTPGLSPAAATEQPVNELQYSIRAALLHSQSSVQNPNPLSRIQPALARLQQPNPLSIPLTGIPQHYINYQLPHAPSWMQPPIQIQQSSNPISAPISRTSIAVNNFNIPDQYIFSNSPIPERTYSPPQTPTVAPPAYVDPGQEEIPETTPLIIVT